MLRASLLAPSAPEALLETNRALELLLDKIRSFGGTIEGRGPTGIAAAFGLDPTEDAPSRAAHAAMAIVNAVTRARQDAGTGPAIKVGVHTSPILVGRGAGVPELDLEGKQAALIVLNTLMARGDADSVTVSEATAPFLMRGFEFRELDGEEYGRGRVYTLVGRGRMGPGQAGRASTFVGRNRELELLSSRLESAIRGRGQIVGISGEAGIGKSRLIFEFRESLTGKGVTYLEGHCHSHGTAVPYLPILDVIRAACGIEEGDALAVMADKARSTLLEAGMDLLETAPYMLHLLDIEHDPERFARTEPRRDEGADLRHAPPADVAEEPAGAAGHRGRGPALDRRDVRGVPRVARGDTAGSPRPDGVHASRRVPTFLDREVVHDAGRAPAARPRGQPPHREVGARPGRGDGRPL